MDVLTFFLFFFLGSKVGKQKKLYLSHYSCDQIWSIVFNLVMVTVVIASPLRTLNLVSVKPRTSLKFMNGITKNSQSSFCEANDFYQFMNGMTKIPCI